MKSSIDWIAAAGTIVSIVIFYVMFRNMPDPNATQPPPPAPVMAAPAPVPAVAPIAVPDATGKVAQAQSQQFAALLAAANGDDWAQVAALTAELKQHESFERGNRAKSKALDGRGAEALRRKDHVAAIKAFQAALRADESNLDARNNLGSAFIGSGQFGFAIDALSALLQAAPEHSKGWRNMAEAAALYGNAADADASLRLLLHYAKDRKASVAALRKRAASGPTDKFGEAVSRVLMLSS